jgi:N-acetylated-alpha-linked acidic dipeptidase
MYPGDPTTPGVPAYENATRTDGLNIPSIPSLPISWVNAQVLLGELKGANRAVKLVNRVDTRVTPIWNPMGVIPGHIRDEVIVVGNHRDAWVLGAADPTSGTVSVHEVLRGLGVLLRAGWKPLRTIVFASWDAEEYGLIGSTEWGEDFGDWVQDHVIAYFNLDSSVAGSRFDAGGSPSFSHFIRDTAQAIPHPTDPGRTLWDARHDKGPLFGEHLDAESAALYEDDFIMRDDIGVKPLGSGSDYTVFLQRLGVASLNSGFSGAPAPSLVAHSPLTLSTGTLSDPVYHYHSIFDSERWQEVYSDPGFVKHVAIAQLLGLQTIRLADSIVLPVNTTHYALQLEGYLDAVQELAEASALALNLAPLRASIKSLQHASAKLDHRKSHAERRMRRAIRWFEHWRRHHGHHGHSLTAMFRAACGGVKHMLGFEVEEHRPMHGVHHGHHSAAWGEAHVQAHKHEEHGPSEENREHKHGEEKHPDHEHKHAEHHHHHSEEHDAHKTVARTGKPGGCTRHLLKHVQTHEGASARPRLPHLPWNPKKALMKAAKEVRAVNAKLAKFEQGFIHGDGIKDREWYRHLGVAPGKWLGASPFFPSPSFPFAPWGLRYVLQDTARRRCRLSRRRSRSRRTLRSRCTKPNGSRA